MAALIVPLTDRAGGEFEPRIERVQQGRFADPAVSSKDAQLSGQRFRESRNALPCCGGAKNDRNTRVLVGPQLVKFFGVLQQIDFVDAQQRLGARSPGGDEVAIDQARPQRRRLERDNVDHDVNIGRDDSLQVGIPRVGAGEHGAARKNLLDTTAIGGEQHTVADCCITGRAAANALVAA